MKNLFTALCAAILFTTAMAQTPQSMNYQAVARNSAGAVVANQSTGQPIKRQHPPQQFYVMIGFSPTQTYPKVFALHTTKLSPFVS